MRHLAKFQIDVRIKHYLARAGIEPTKFPKFRSILLVNHPLIYKVGESQLEHMLSIVLPNAAKVGLIRNKFLLMRVHHILFRNHFRD
jgi:hypothetical protein